MFNFKRNLIVAFIFFLALPVAVSAAGKPVDLYFFEGQGCPHCARMKSFLDGLKADYPNLTVKDFEVYFNKENQDLFGRMAAAYGSDAEGVPTLFIGEEVIKGEAYETLKNAVIKCSAEGCISPAEKLESGNTNTVINNNENINTNQSSSGGQKKNEMVGWIVIGFIAIAGLIGIIYILKNKK